jgi:ABC-2 type transport system permease protein
MVKNNMNITDLLRQELRVLFWGKFPAALWLFGVPLLFCLLFGLVYSPNVVKNIPLVVYDQDQTATSRIAVQAFLDSERYDIVAQVTSQEAMEQYLTNHDAVASLVIPPDFSENIKLGRAAQLLIEVNAANLMYANTILSTSQEIVQTLSVGISQKLLEGVNKLPEQALRLAMPVGFSVRILNNPTLSYSNFVLPGMGGNGLQIGIILVASTLLTKEYARLSLWTNVSSAALVIGKIVPTWLVSLAAYFAYLAYLIQGFGIPFRGDVSSLLMIGSAFCFAIIGVGVFFSALSPTEIMAIQSPVLYIMPAFLFSGYSWPLVAMNGFSRTLSNLMPFTYFADTLRDILLVGYAPDLVKNTVILFLFGMVLSLFAIVIFVVKRRWLQTRPHVLNKEVGA